MKKRGDWTSPSGLLAFTLWDEHDFPELAPLLEIRLGVTRFIKRKRAIDDGTDFPPPESLEASR